ncbi:MAG TPA: hypothetical protein VHZ74_16135 [Bryobacteraceae bacterium]|nr:hypothetical protein [Bryobacteraceae bacterium]
MSTRNICLAIFLLAFGIRSSQLFTLPANELRFSPAPPEALRAWDEGINTAYTLVSGGGFADPFLSAPSGSSAHAAPSFPVVTAALFYVFGTGMTGGIARDVLEIAGYSLLFASLPWFALRLGMTAVPGIVSGVGAALYPFYSPHLMTRGRDEWLAGLAGMALLVFGLRLARAETLTRLSALLYGAAWGALMYVLPSMMPILAAHVLIIFFARRRPGSERLAFGVLFGVAFVLIVLPWTIRNRVVMGGWIFMRDDAGLELEVSNHDGATPSFDGNFANGTFCAIHPNCNAAAANRILQIGELEFNRDAMATAVEWIRRHPSRFLMLTLRRAADFWFGLRADAGLFLAKALVWLLGAAGLGLMWRRGFQLETSLMGVCWVVYPLVYYLIQYNERYPVAISPAILLPAGYMAVQLYLKARNSFAIGSKN